MQKFPTAEIILSLEKYISVKKKKPFVQRQFSNEIATTW